MYKSSAEIVAELQQINTLCMLYLTEQELLSDFNKWLADKEFRILIQQEKKEG